MSRQLPPLDMHAHVETSVPQRDLEGLGAVVFAATRSQKEFTQTLDRHDQIVVWGLGCHPGVPVAHVSFDADAFREQLAATPFVSEIGLDSRSKVPAAEQQQTFRSILELCKGSPRILSVHSSGRTQQVLDLVEDVHIDGIVLHWWLGTEQETRRAIELGCYFSVNYAMLGKPQLNAIPHDRLLLETDHPSGDRRSSRPRRPGNTHTVEEEIARLSGKDVAFVRDLQWQNLVRLVDQLTLTHLFPVAIQRMLAYSRR
ncbi:TatD family hydrolase [Nocardia puris]|uniref:TatD DNase family protein n=2 Tax=Nocardia puris TaxID=208602 RepID=A0A366CZB7_9NOCA|nr:TatD DNase family protein [Nocardia puris]